MLKKVFILAPMLALVTTACVQDGNEPPESIAGLSTERSCFFVQQVNGYSEAPDGPRGERLYVNVGVRDRYLLENFGACPELDWSLQIGIDPDHMSSICTGDTVTLVIPQSMGGCPIAARPACWARWKKSEGCGRGEHCERGLRHGFAIRIVCVTVQGEEP